MQLQVAFISNLELCFNRTKNSFHVAILSWPEFGLYEHYVQEH